ncbi:ABC transporter permease [Virgibacillus oceani]|uniref:ABC transporter permease/ATP-binding protein n=1 Tax=Virgibacillus oceani TaxID=1479511 RepID=A0A917HPP5_9BACI|nr:ABC transporter permease [Virgibacillus oceani]GGG86535.1 ABC transporter permease/ATP-binding protein [Virgibacillus oceani]
MIGILLAKIKIFIRYPLTFLAMVVMSIGFALLIGGGNGNVINVPTYIADEAIHGTVVEDILNDSEAFNFETMSKDEVEDKIANGKAEIGVELYEGDFRVIVGVESPNVGLVKQTVEGAYSKKLQYEQLFAAANATTDSDKEAVKTDLEKAIADPVFSIQANNFRGSDAVIIDNRYHTLFGFTLFFVIYTIAYNVFHILEEKNNGVWDRIILSPARKWEMYVANFMYSFGTGFLQVLIIFLVFRFWVGIEFGGNFGKAILVLIPYVFSIVALSILITGIVKTVQQFNAVIPIIAVSMAMIGGAFWPLEIVSSKLMLVLSKVVPITYGMEVLNGVAIYGYSFSEILYPISILLLMGVVMTGIGIHLMEKRHV